MDKENVVYMRDGVFVSHKENGILLFVGTWTELGITVSSKTNQIQKDKDHMLFSHTWNLDLKYMYICTYKERKKERKKQND
jgi:hypothetical protein